MKHNLCGAMIALVVFGSAVSVYGAMDQFPAFFRGGFNTSLAVWDFDTSSDPFTANDGTFPFGPTGGPAVDITPKSGSSWLNELDGRQGVWTLGQLDVTMQNGPETGPDTYKNIWIQVTWKPVTQDSEPSVSIVGHSEQFPYVQYAQSALFEDRDLGEGWVTSAYNLLIFPNPSWEWLRVEGDIYVDDMVIDTQCIPEPASLLIFGIGSLMLVRRHKNR